MIESMAVISLCLVALLAALAVLSDVVRDNIVERIGLAAICITALGRAAVLHMDGETPVSSMLLFCALGVYALGSAWEKFKLWLAAREGRAVRQQQEIAEPFKQAAGLGSTTTKGES